MLYFEVPVDHNQMELQDFSSIDKNEYLYHEIQGRWLRWSQTVFDPVALVDLWVSLCSCRKVTRFGTEPEPSAPHTGAADSADYCVPHCPYRPWTVTPTSSTGPARPHCIQHFNTQLQRLPYLLAATVFISSVVVYLVQPPRSYSALRAKLIQV